ncbi:MAG TPA: SpoIID/LytB domain-containing protein [Gaiellaceae bacterium]|nr:SpoIID/LytB domain-containing protein [Gaiellaceae bacterium]
MPFRALAAAVAAVAVAPAGAAAAPAPPPPPGTPAVTFLVSGHGWGHGLGMSQWGARGYALHGWTYDRILAHYYQGTTLGPAPVSKVRVLLADGATSLKLGSTGAWTVVDGSGQTHDLEPGTLALGPALRITASGAADPAALPGPLSFASKGTPLRLGKTSYRGSIQVTKTKGGKLQAVDVVGLEDYLRGVVPAEMPSTWPPEALKAQAVAARSYALAQRATGKPYDLFADVRSQVYGGVGAESAAASAAIDATRGIVVLSGGEVADTLFFSSSGGRTASYAEAFSGGPLSYLVSVDDPYDESPYVNWGPVAVDGAKAAKALGVHGPVEGIDTVTGPSGRVVTATLTLPAGTKQVTGGELRTKLGLRSTWLEPIGLLELRTAAAKLTVGGRTMLSGLVRGAGTDAPQLEQRAAGAAWTTAAAPKLAADGSFSLRVRPAATTQYRLVAGTLRGSVAKLPVAPAVRLDTGLRGTVRPAVLDRQVQVQVQTGPRWLTVATVPVDAAGAFSAGALGPGTYRARYAPGGGLAPGLSAPLVVQ